MFSRYSTLKNRLIASDGGDEVRRGRGSIDEILDHLDESLYLKSHVWPEARSSTQDNARLPLILGRSSKEKNYSHFLDTTDLLSAI